MTNIHTWLKGKLHPGIGHEHPEGEQRYSCALPDEGGWPTSRPGRFNPGKRTGTHCTGCWVGSGTVRMGVENLAPTGIRSADRPARSMIAIQTELSGPSDT
jgi:hypothetical protein